MPDRACLQFFAALTLASVLAGNVIAQAQQPDDITAGYLGTEVCSTCHLQTSGHWNHTVHAVLFLGNPANELEARGCESCHGPGSAHRLNPADKSRIVRFTMGSENPVSEQNGMCIACHEGGNLMHWAGSGHETEELSCADCHNPMAEYSVSGALAGTTINETCFACHKAQKSEFSRRSHMPLPEGRMTCLDCHNPHGTVTDPLLVGDTLNETCYRCHAEKRGPFLFEHAPVRSDCMNCHTAHGSNHDSQLVTAQPVLCQQCHTSLGHMNELLSRRNAPAGPAPDPRVVGRSCVNCHMQVHGSNHPAGSKLQR